eukprot:898639-Rhodomonas_salina.3
MLCCLVQICALCVSRTSLPSSCSLPPSSLSLSRAVPRCALCYALTGTDGLAIVLRACYGMSGTDERYAPTRSVGDLVGGPFIAALRLFATTLGPTLVRFSRRMHVIGGAHGVSARTVPMDRTLSELGREGGGGGWRGGGQECGTTLGTHRTIGCYAGVVKVVVQVPAYGYAMRRPVLEMVSAMIPQGIA